MPVEFRLEPTGSSSDTLFRLLMKYDGTGRRISKTVMHKVAGVADWDTAQVTHYTGIGTEIRENYAGPAKQTKVVVNMPQGLGRYGIEDAAAANANASKNFEWYLKNHLGSTMLVYGTVASTNPNEADVGEKIAAYDYRAFGEMLELTPPPTDKVTENFTGSRFARRTQRTACKSIAEPKNLGAKRNEHDDEIALNYFGARYLDPMLGMWISVDPKRQYYHSYIYANNNPVIRIDPDGNQDDIAAMIRGQFFREQQINTAAAMKQLPSAFKQGVIDASRYVSFAEIAIPVTCALVGVSMPIGLMVGFIAYNAVSSGLQYGADGVIASLTIDIAFAKFGFNFAPGGRYAKTILGSPLKHASSTGVQNAANNFSHDAADIILSPTISESQENIPIPEKSSSIMPTSSSVAPMEDD